MNFQEGLLQFLPILIAFGSAISICIARLAFGIWRSVTSEIVKIDPFSLADLVKAIIAVLTTLAYLGMLFLCLFYAYIPFYAQTFDTLLKWSFVPGMIWGAYFTSLSSRS